MFVWEFFGYMCMVWLLIVVVVYWFVMVLFGLLFFLFVIDVGVCLFVQFAVFGWVMFVVLFLV